MFAGVGQTPGRGAVAQFPPEELVEVVEGIGPALGIGGRQRLPHHRRQTRQSQPVIGIGQRTPADLPWSDGLDRLSQIRIRLFDLGLIGVHPDGIGFGNISLREEGEAFRITGTGTGRHRILDPERWCRVVWFSPELNQVRSHGMVEASAESMTHGAIYRARRDAHCVIHVHSRRLFDTLLAGDCPRTPPSVAHGTLDMAQAVAALAARAPALPALLVTTGHDEGVIAYGADPVSTCEALIAAVPQELPSMVC
jgi:hypothetical protein